jgi:hypothetical protein
MKRWIVGLVVVVAVWGFGQAEAAIVYYDSFSRTGDLNGSTPDITWNTNAWVATAGTTDASVCGVPSSNFWATLPFTPIGYYVYTLSVDAAPQNGNPDSWLSLGFMNDMDQTKAQQSPWMLVRGDGKIGAFGGPTAIVNFVYNGPGGNPGEYNNLRMVLDTTHAAWTSAFYVNGTQVGSTSTYASNPTIVGVHLQNGDISGSYDNFSLTSAAVPEPSSIVVMGGLFATFGIAALWRRRRAT